MVFPRNGGWVGLVLDGSWGKRPGAPTWVDELTVPPEVPRPVHGRHKIWGGWGLVGASLGESADRGSRYRWRLDRTRVWLNQSINHSNNPPDHSFLLTILNLLRGASSCRILVLSTVTSLYLVLYLVRQTFLKHRPGRMGRKHSTCSAASLRQTGCRLLTAY